MLNSRNEYKTPRCETHNSFPYKPSQARNLNNQHLASQRTSLKIIEFSYTKTRSMYLLTKTFTEKLSGCIMNLYIWLIQGFKRPKILSKENTIGMELANLLQITVGDVQLAKLQKSGYVQ